MRSLLAILLCLLTVLPAPLTAQWLEPGPPVCEDAAEECAPAACACCAMSCHCQAQEGEQSPPSTPVLPPGDGSRLQPALLPQEVPPAGLVVSAVGEKSLRVAVSRPHLCVRRVPLYVRHRAFLM